MTGDRRRAEDRRVSGDSAGPATDRNNAPVIDPTANVLQLVEAAIERIDGLLKAATTRTDDLREQAVRRQDDLREAESKHRSEVDHLRDEHARELRAKETERIDAIRAVDVAAVQTAATAAEVRATTLAAQVTALAEATRTATATALKPLQDQLADVTRYMYEGQGSKDRGSSSQVLLFAILGVLGTAIVIALGLYGATH